MKIWGYMLTGALMAAPMLAGAVTITGDDNGTGVAGVMPTDGTRFVIPFTNDAGFDAVVGISIAGVATGDLGQFSLALSAVEFGLSPDASTNVGQRFTVGDFIIPASAASNFADYALGDGDTVNLIFEMPSGFNFDGESLLLTYAYASEVLPLSPVAPVPLPATALLLLGSLGGLTLLRRKMSA